MAKKNKQYVASVKKTVDAGLGISNASHSKSTDAPTYKKQKQAPNPLRHPMFEAPPPPDISGPSKAPPPPKPVREEGSNTRSLEVLEILKLLVQV